VDGLKKKIGPKRFEFGSTRYAALCYSELIGPPRPYLCAASLSETRRTTPFGGRRGFTIGLSTSTSSHALATLLATIVRASPMVVDADSNPRPSKRSRSSVACSRCKDRRQKVSFADRTGLYSDLRVIPTSTATSTSPATATATDFSVRQLCAVMLKLRQSGRQMPVQRRRTPGVVRRVSRGEDTSTRRRLPGVTSVFGVVQSYGAGAGAGASRLQQP
jgi:hypothetical protein